MNYTTDLSGTLIRDISDNLWKFSIKTVNSDTVVLKPGFWRVRRGVPGDLVVPPPFLKGAVLVFRIVGARTFVVEAEVDTACTDFDRTIYTAVIEGTCDEAISAELGFYVKPVFFSIVG